MFNNIITKNSLKDTIEREGNEQKKWKKTIETCKIDKSVSYSVASNFL